MGNDERIRSLERAVDEGVPGADEELARLLRTDAWAPDDAAARFGDAVSRVVDEAANGGMRRKPAFMSALAREARRAGFELTNFPAMRSARAWVRHGKRSTTSGAAAEWSPNKTAFPYDPADSASGLFHVVFAFVDDGVTVGVTRRPRDWAGLSWPPPFHGMPDERIRAWAEAALPDRTRTSYATFMEWAGRASKP